MGVIFLHICRQGDKPREKRFNKTINLKAFNVLLE